MNTMIAEDQLQIYYYAGPQIVKVRCVMVFSVVWALGLLAAAYNLFYNYGLSPADGGVLAPLAERIAWAAGVALLGVAFPVAMRIYAACYVESIEIDNENGDASAVYSTLTFFGIRQQLIEAKDILSVKHHSGELNRGGSYAPCRAQRKSALVKPSYSESTFAVYH